ncbi:MAG: tetratricopeptide repeat protein [Flavobacteriales bacterium]|nr:tetratricopeptide repeat protein [Flavobacteriales bacterium]
MELRIVAIILSLIFSVISFGQDLVLDSLETELKNCTDHVSCTKTKYEIGNYEHTFRLSFWDSIINACEGYNELILTKGLSHNIAGFISDYIGERNQADIHFHEAIDIFEKEKDSSNLSVSIWNLAVHYQDIGDYVNALDLMNQALDLSLKMKDLQLIAEAYNGLAVTYDYLGNQMQSLHYYELAYSNMLKAADTAGMAYVLTNMGTIYSDQDDPESAESNYLKSIELLKLSHNLETDYYYTNLNNLATIYNKRGEKQKAEEIFLKNIAYYKEMDNPLEYASGLLNLALIHSETGQPKKAEEEFKETIDIYTSLETNYELAKTKREYAKFLIQSYRTEEGLKLIKEVYKDALNMSSLELQYEVTEVMIDGFMAIKDFESALIYQKKHEQLGDQLLNEQTKKATIGQQFEIEYLAKVAADSIKNAEKEKLQQAELAAEKSEKEKLQLESKQRKQQNIFLIVGLSITVLFGLFIFNRFQVTRKQKSIIEDQKHQVDAAYETLEEKNQEILDSITYAKRIQTAILPSDEKWDSLMRNAFVLYLPKDIVAGDFYWLELKEDITFFAAADCTGHGVPGAMVSVVCNSALNKVVGELGYMKPGEILDETKKIIVDEFSKSSEDVKDGMDIALCRLELRKDGYHLMYAGANNPLWIIRKDSNEVEEIKGDKQPIGKSDSTKNFTNHDLKVFSGDTLYIFSDGFADQFGGEAGKKLKTGNFKKLLLDLQQFEMSEQQTKIHSYFNAWKEGYDQLDDVCVIGLRLE